MNFKKLKFSDQDIKKIKDFHEKLKSKKLAPYELSNIIAGCGALCEITCSYHCEPTCGLTCLSTCTEACGKTCITSCATLFVTGSGCEICAISWSEIWY